MAIETDYTDTDLWTNEDLDQHWVRITAERERRRKIEAIPELLNQQLGEYQKAAGVHTDGEEWVQPTSYLDVYMKDAVVTHSGKTWTSNIDNNALEPGVSGWTEVLPEGEYPDWVQPQGYQDAYEPGTIVKYQGHLWRNDHIGGNAWEPGTPGAMWTDLGPTPA